MKERLRQNPLVAFEKCLEFFRLVDPRRRDKKTGKYPDWRIYSSDRKCLLKAVEEVEYENTLKISLLLLGKEYWESDNIRKHFNIREGSKERKFITLAFNLERKYERFNENKQREKRRKESCRRRNKILSKVNKKDSKRCQGYIDALFTERDLKRWWGKEKRKAVNKEYDEE